MKERTPSIEKLEKQLRVLRKKLERSERHRTDLENQHNRDQHLYRRLHADLEAARREAKIEAALERVRAKAMAMHSSKDLAATVSLVFRELRNLDVTPLRCGLGLLDEDTRVVEIFTTSITREDHALELVGLFKMDIHPVLEEVFAHWTRQQEHHALLQGETLKSYFRQLKPHLAVPDWQDDFVQYGHFFFFPEGALYAWTESPPAEEELRIYRKFTSVLGLTYRRYLDLTEAEARAREATRQAALDRVRAEIASMRTADDLEHITPLIWRELTTLGVPFFRCGVFIMDEATEAVQVFLTNPEGKALAVLPLDFTDAPLVQAAVDHWRRVTVYTETWDTADMEAWMAFLQARGLITEPTQYLDAEAPPERLALHFVPFEQGMLYVGSTTLLPAASIDDVQALADAFAVAYARYEDFQRLEAAKAEVEIALQELKATQAQLIHAEKMASLGQMTSGIAHEIKNPLNFVNNFAELSGELADELAEALAEGEEVTEILADLKQNAQAIAQHGKRADGIVRAMMQHASGGSGKQEMTAVNALVEEYLNLAYHGKRASEPGFNVDLTSTYDPEVDRVPMLPQEIGRVLLNLLGNAFDAVYEQASSINGQERRMAIRPYTPAVRISTKRLAGQVEIRVSDNGPGIPSDIKEKIFEPFFTTKPTGSGTGLGLSLSYDIVTQGHGGTLTVESTEGEGATFILTLPTPSRR